MRYFFSLISGHKLNLVEIHTPHPFSSKFYAQKIYEEISHAKIKPQNFNVVFILLEGWEATFIKSYGSKDEVTPFFDSLRKRSITTAQTLSGGNRTPEGLFTIFCSYQNPLGKSVVHSQLENQDYTCLPQILKEEGWETSFLQGTNSMTSGVGALANKVGFTRSLGKKDNPNYAHLEKNSWGLFDKDLYDWSLDEMKNTKEPFLFGINTTTTHSRELRHNEAFKFGKNNAINIKKSTLYSSDQDLKYFIEKAESLTWEHPLLFVLVSDHASFLAKTPYNSSRIAFAIYSKELPARFFDFAISQRDIAPTVLDLLGIKNEDMTGVSLFSNRKLHFAEYYQKDRLGSILNDSLIEWNPQNLSDEKCYNWRTDFHQDYPIPCSTEAKEAKLIGLSFTKLSQEFLFKGHARELKKEILKK